MFDDFETINPADLSEVKNPNGGNSAGYGDFQRQQQQAQQPQQQQQQQPQQNYSGNQQYKGGQSNNQYQGQRNSNWQNNQSGGGGQFRGKGGGGQWNNKKDDVIEEPYVPIAIYIDRDFPDEIKQKLISIASRLINNKMVVRYNADDVEIHNAISEISTAKTEAYTPWKMFNNIESKHYYNTETAKHVASSNFQGWDKIPDAVKAMLARNVRLIFGDKNRSPAICLITWSPDGASRAPEVTKDTGKSGFLIKLASTYGFSVLNIAKPNAEAVLEKAFNL